MFKTGDRVCTEFGDGTVADSSLRRVYIELDDGSPLNVATGTPGYARIIALAAGPCVRDH